MTLNQLEQLVALSRATSLSDVSQELKISPNVLLKNIAQLEEEYKTELFKKLVPTIELTPVGERLVARARLILMQVDDLKWMCQSATENLKNLENDQTNDVPLDMSKEEDIKRALRLQYENLYQSVPGTFIERLNPHIVSVSTEKHEAVVRFQTQEWMRNARNSVHGGVLSAMADNAMAVLLRVINGGLGGPTVNLSVNFIRGVPIGEPIYVRAACQKAGKRILFINCEAYMDNAPSEALFTAQGIFCSL